FSLFMKIFRDPCPVSLQVNYMKNIKTCFLRTGHVQKMYKQTGHMRAFAQSCSQDACLKRMRGDFLRGEQWLRRLKLPGI
ncbi:hypothetical protein ODZ43_27595, partial [Escherichia coli]|nr:hypothetical protein [Escherichia coli]